MTSNMDINNVSFIALDKTEDDKVEEKERYNSFLTL